MAVNQAFAGRTYPPTAPYEVSRAKIADFADAIGDPNPVYRDRSAAQALGHPDVIAPPTFPIVLTLPAGHQFSFDPESGVEYGRVVHGEQRFVHQRPLYPGDIVQAVLTIDSIRQAAGNDLIVTSTELRTVEGELVSTAYSTIVVRGEGK